MERLGRYSSGSNFATSSVRRWNSETMRLSNGAASPCTRGRRFALVSFINATERGFS